MLSPTTKDVIRIIRTYAYRNGISMTSFAKQAGVSKAWLSRLRHEGGDLSLDYATKLLEAAGYKLIVKHNGQLNASDTEAIDLIDDETALKNDDKNQFKEDGSEKAKQKDKSDDKPDKEKEDKSAVKRLKRRLNS